MKRIVALVLVLLCVMFAGCKGPVKPGPATPDTATPDMATPDIPPETTEPATEPPTTLANDLFDPEEDAPLVGVWQTTVILDGELFNLAEMEAKVEMQLAYRLNADGTYTRGVDPEEYKTAIATYCDAVEAFMLDRLYAKFKAEKRLEKVDKDDIPDLWEKEQKADAEEQAKRFVEGLYLDYRFSELNSSGDYYVEDGKLMFSCPDGTYEACGYALTEEGLSITEVPNPNVYRQLQLELPLLLTKAE